MRGRPDKKQAPMGATEFEDWALRLQADGLDALGDRREDAIREYRGLLNHLQENAGRSDDDAALYLRAVEGVSVDELTHLDLMKIARDIGASITTADSLFLNIAARRRIKQLGPVPENYLGISKDFDQVFANAFDLQVPQVKFAGLLADVPESLRTGTVLKPERSSDSRGVFYLFGEDHIRSVQHSISHPHWSAMVDAIEAELGTRFVHDERWQIQELIYEDEESTPARDLKFYTFYGEIALILEVCRHETRQYEYFHPDRTAALCGREHEPRFADASLTIVDNGGVPDSYLAEVQELSRQIPVPFMRIDYLNGVDGLVFNEMSSAPGQSHAWSDEYDRRLGKMYTEAQIRLLNDLLDGKEFARYQRFRLLQRDHRRRRTEPARAGASVNPDLDRRLKTSHRGRPASPMAFSSEDSRYWDHVLETSSLAAVLDDRSWSAQRHRMLLEHLRRRAGRSDQDSKLYLQAIDAASIDELTHVDLVTIGRTLKAELSTADSFFRAIALRRRKKELGSVPEKYLGLSRATDRQFADDLDISTLEVVFTGSLDAVPAEVRAGTLLAPVGSASPKVAFHLSAADHIFSLEHDRVLTGWPAMIEDIEKQLGPETLNDTTWEVCKFVSDPSGAPAREIKIYAFYGEVGLIREGSGHGRARCQYFDVDGTVADCGRIHELRSADAASGFVTRGGLQSSHLDPIRALSREIPVPFMCFDYLDGANGLVFLGMSSAPGMAHTFSDNYDRHLGKMYAEAEIRLTHDLLDGKRFDTHRRFVETRKEARAGNKRA